MRAVEILIYVQTESRTFSYSSDCFLSLVFSDPEKNTWVFGRVLVPDPLLCSQNRGLNRALER